MMKFKVFPIIVMSMIAWMLINHAHGRALTQDLPSYKILATSESVDILIIGCKIFQPIDENTLKLLSEKVYSEHGGNNYKHVSMLWYILNKKYENYTLGFAEFNDGHLWRIGIPQPIQFKQ